MALAEGMTLADPVAEQDGGRIRTNDEEGSVKGKARG